ncbi:MAG: hypothetical protein V3V08_23500 [Nannocystaceae bacterium]
MSETAANVMVAMLVAFVFIGLGGTGLWGCPKYRVYNAEMTGRAELARAEQNRQIAVHQAKAKVEAATHEAQAEIVRAEGAAKAMAAIQDQLTEKYLHYLWVQGLNEGTNDVIYVATEATMPITEANRFRSDPAGE